jgi:simple sugar transport system permease protein
MLFTFLVGPWASLYFAGNSLDFFALLLCAAVAALIAFRGGLFNIGLDGQIYSGGVAASFVMLFLPQTLPAGLMLAVAALSAAGIGFLMGSFCGFLKKTTGASEIITTFLLSSAIFPLADYLIQNFLRGKSDNLLASRHFSENYILPHFFSVSNLNISFIITLFFPFLLYFFLTRSTIGYRFRIAGASPAFARYGGINPEAYQIPVLGISGAFAGLCGFFAVAGTYGLCYQGFSGGIGWAALAVALIARSNPLALIPAALFYTVIKLGADQVLLTAGISFETSSLIQAAILFFATVKLNFWANLSKIKQNKGKSVKV